ncbi:MAG: type II secretion system F family protein [Actinomycetota bacterium]
MTPQALAPVLAGAAVVLAGRAVATGERERLLRRAGAKTGGASPRVGVRERIRTLPGSRRARRPARPVVTTLAGVGLGVVAGLALAGPVGAVAGAAIGVWVPRWRRARRSERRFELIEGQLADSMDGIAAALRAGMSPSQAVAFAADEGSPPLSDSLRAVVQRESLGMSFDESLDVLARQEPGDDVRLAVAVLQLQHRVGGDAPVILDDAVRTLRQRVAAAGELRSLTAQARLSGTILGLLPIGFFLFMSVISRHDVTAALSTPLGLISAALGLALDGSAFLWIRHLLRGAS